MYKSFWNGPFLVSLPDWEVLHFLADTGQTWAETCFSYCSSGSHPSGRVILLLPSTSPDWTHLTRLYPTVPWVEVLSTFQAWPLHWCWSRSSGCSSLLLPNLQMLLSSLCPHHNPPSPIDGCEARFRGEVFCPGSAKLDAVDSESVWLDCMIWSTQEAAGLWWWQGRQAVLDNPKLSFSVLDNPRLGTQNGRKSLLPPLHSCCFAVLSPCWKFPNV